jgi:hypothetical protein
MQLINIGFGNIVSAERIISIVSPEAAPIKRMIQEAKDIISIQFENSREELMSMDDSELTVDEYYQKQLLLLLTPETIQEGIDNVPVTEIIAAVLKGKNIDLDLVPEDKKEEYERIMEEYEKAKAEELEQKETTESATKTQNDDTESEIIPTE